MLQLISVVGIFQLSQLDWIVMIVKFVTAVLQSDRVDGDLKVQANGLDTRMPVQSIGVPFNISKLQFLKIAISQNFNISNLQYLKI